MSTCGSFPDSYWVVEGLLLAGEHPARASSARTRDRVAQLLDAGIRTFIDLTEERERLTKYSRMLERLSAAGHLTTTYVRRGVRYGGVPREREEVASILRMMRDEIAAGRPVYVHCRNGAGRTGTIIGCWLVEHGMTGAAAIGKIALLREHSPNAPIPSPETVEQVRFVCDWKRGVLTGLTLDARTAATAAPAVSGPTVPSAFA